MLFLSFIIALVAVWIEIDISEQYLSFTPVPLIVALISGWDLISRWRQVQRFNLILESGQWDEEWMTEKDISRARLRILATPIYFVVAIFSLIVALLRQS